ncbi:MAG: sigma-70 family RNA polymerase sigma factor [Acidimicrobiales bacterium]
MTSAAITPCRSALEDNLVRQHLGLVTTAVNQMIGRLPRHICRDDLVSAGMAALAQAARSYDETRETGFERHACARIRGALIDELRQRDWASRSVRTRARRLLGATEDLTARLGRVPTDAELAGRLGVTVAGVAAVHCDVERARVLSFDGLVCDDPEVVLPADDRSPELAVIEEERRAYMVDAVATLPTRLRRIIAGYFFEERTSQELADELGVSTSRISQLRTEALGLLRVTMEARTGSEAVAVGVAR